MTRYEESQYQQIFVGNLQEIKQRLEQEIKEKQEKLIEVNNKLSIELEYLQELLQKEK